MKEISLFLTLCQREASNFRSIKERNTIALRNLDWKPRFLSSPEE
jgi:hypothetical protein